MKPMYIIAALCTATISTVFADKAGEASSVVKTVQSRLKTGVVPHYRSLQKQLKASFKAALAAKKAKNKEAIATLRAEQKEVLTALRAHYTSAHQAYPTLKEHVEATRALVNHLIQHAEKLAEKKTATALSETSDWLATIEQASTKAGIYSTDTSAGMEEQAPKKKKRATRK